jgi:hypothetical protein
MVERERCRSRSQGRGRALDTEGDAVTRVLLIVLGAVLVVLVVRLVLR